MDDPLEGVGGYCHVSSTGTEPGRRTTCRSNASLSVGKSTRKCEPLLSSRVERRLGDEAREQMRHAEEVAEAGCVADQAAVAPERRPQLGRDGLGGWDLRNLGQAGREPWLRKRGERGPTPEDEALEERVRREPVRTVHAGRRALTGCVEAGKLAPPVEVRRDTAHGVVRCGRNRDRSLRRVVALLDEAAHERREATAVDRPQVEQHRPARCDLPGDDVARSELVGEAVALVVEEQGALAAQRLGEEERRVDERRRMELDELEVGERGAGTVRGRHALADGSCRVRRPLPQRRRASRGEQRRACRDRAAVGHDPDAALVVAPDGEHSLALRHPNTRVREHALGELPRDPVPRRGSARVHDAPSAVATLEAETLVELDAELDEVADARGRLLRQHGDGARAAEPATGAQGVLRVQRRRVVGAHRGGDPALGEEARRREERPLGEHEHVAFRGRAQRREEAGDAAAHDDERKLGVAGDISGFAHGSFSL